jgi:hypothetical protein
VVYNVGIAISTCVGAIYIVVNAASKRVFFLWRSTPYVRRNGNPSDYDTDVDWNMDSHTETTTDDQPFTVVNSRKKRKRTRTNQEHSNDFRAGPQTGPRTSATPHASHVERRRGPLIIGKLSATGVNSAPSIVAARPLVQKAVFLH